MISKELLEAINKQINAEMWSAYLYLSMAMDAEYKGYPGVANWFKIQFSEEQDHARILMNYLHSQDCKVELEAIDAVPTHWDSVLDMYKQTLEHEKKVTKMINDVTAIAHKDHDFASMNRMMWFINEQVEEEETARGMIDALEAVEGNKYGMYMLDKELAGRTYTQTSALTE